MQVRELFNPDYGMFVYDETTRLHWFRPSDLDIDTEFELVGILIGERVRGVSPGLPQDTCGWVCSASGLAVSPRVL
jgi:hypothetical protein